MQKSRSFQTSWKVLTQLTKNVTGTFGFGFMKVWLNLTLLERNAYVRHWSYKCLVEPNVLKTLFKYSDSVYNPNEMQKGSKRILKLNTRCQESVKQSVPPAG